MSIKRVTIEGDVALEGLLREGQGRGRVVICHPHPLYGGSMHNNVVEAVEDGFHGLGFTTLRFNFRGVGNSGGNYDEGEGEIDDVVAAWDYLKEQRVGEVPAILVGYSFGAWVCSRAAVRVADVEALFLVAYPFSVYSTDELEQFQKPIYFVGGSLDDISPLKQLMDFYRQVKNEKFLKIVPSSHFFNGFEQEITDFIGAEF